LGIASFGILCQLFLNTAANTVVELCGFDSSQVKARLPNGEELAEPQDLIFHMDGFATQSHNLQWMCKQLGAKVFLRKILTFR